MRLENNIGWCDETINAVTGCDKVSPGCKNCYAEVGTRARVLRHQGKETWGPKGIREPVNFEPMFRKLNTRCVCDNCAETSPFEAVGQTCGKMDVGAFQPDHACQGRLRRIRLFADSNSDWLDPKWPIETFVKFLDAIRLAPNIYVQLLTKRIELFPSRLLDAMTQADATGMIDLFNWLEHWNFKSAPQNVWLGVSVENQELAYMRIPPLLATPAAVRFLSVEPLLERVDLVLDNRNGPDVGHMAFIDWVIVGGESGAEPVYKKEGSCKYCGARLKSDEHGEHCPTKNCQWALTGTGVPRVQLSGRRDCGVVAIEQVVQQCNAARVPVYCKQDVAFKSGQQGRISDRCWSFKEFPR